MKRLALALLLCGASAVHPPMHLVWSDEFDGPNNAPVDATKWESEVRGAGFGNDERQYYTNATNRSGPFFTTSNAFQDGEGHLVIRARKESVSFDRCWYGGCEYTSARLVTYDTFSQRYGRIEARMKVPEGKGLWTAFWMMGVSANFPQCGEIDVVEVLGRDTTTIYGSAHEPSSMAAIASAINDYRSPSGRFSDGFHVYAIEWRPRRIEYFVDDVRYATVTPKAMPRGGQWVFDRQPFYLILNLAVGSRWPGYPDESTVFPADLVVDYVRVYS